MRLLLLLKVTLCLVLLSISAPLLGQNDNDISLPDGYLSPRGDSVLREVPLKKLSVTGYYRFFGYGRDMSEPYPNLAPYERSIGVGDGYREPMLSMFVSGRPNGKSSFATELFVFTPYNDGTTEGNVLTMNLGLNFYGNFRTKFGKFGVRAGGIHWYAMSPFTMGIFQVIDRFSIFDRTPWEGVNGTEKYQSYFETGAISRDVRWNNRAFQGLIVEGGSLPGRLSFAFLFGKSQVNGGLLNGQTDPLATIVNPGVAGNVPTYAGFAGLNRFVPSSMTGFRLKKDFGNNFIAYNTLYNRQRISPTRLANDSLPFPVQTYALHTLQFLFQPAKLHISGEIGVGNYALPGEEKRYGEVGMVKIGIPKDYTFLPLDVQLYQIGKNFYNDNGEIQTFSNPEIQQATTGPNQVGQPSAGGVLTQVGQLVHNRRGINLNTEARLGPLGINLGWGIARELDTLSNQLSFVHRINGLALSRIYNPFPAGATGPTIVGPYGRVTTFFRGAFETVPLTDVDPQTLAPLTIKNFQSFDVQGKFHTELFKRPLYLFYLGSWMGASPDVRFFPTYREDAYLQATYHELDLYYELFPGFILAGYGGLEYVKGGLNTEWGDSGTLQPRNQFGRAIAFGFDWTVAKNAAFYVRQRYMSFEDRSFVLDRYNGYETTVELKVFF
ncbi:MAG: hypothetical protein AAFR61_03910 [Bacteroidota bacterium]